MTSKTRKPNGAPAKKAKRGTPLRRSKYQIFPPHPPACHEILKTSITNHGVEKPTIWDGDNLLDGWERETVCADLGIRCSRELRNFETDADRFRFILAVNAHRRPSLSQKQKREVIAGYLKGDPGVADNMLGDTLGVSKNTVQKVRRRLEAEEQIPKVSKTKGKDGKLRPVTYTKRIITNTQREFENAKEIIRDLPHNCDGKTVDIATAKRRARIELSKKGREARAANSHPLPDSIRLYHCPFQELEEVAGIKPGSVSLIPTDIPYKNDWIPQVADLGKFAERVLAPGGLLMMMTGIKNIPDILIELNSAKELQYIAKLEVTWKFNGGTPCRVGKRGRIVSFSKPIWVYSKGPFSRKGRFVTPIFSESTEKDWHPHQQPLSLFRYLVQEYSDPGDLIAETCGGGFTTPLAGYLEGRHVIACDNDEKAYMRGVVRLQKAVGGEPDCP